MDHGGWVFSSCSFLRTVIFNGTLSDYCNILYECDTKSSWNMEGTPLAYCTDLIVDGKVIEGDLKIPVGVTSISPYAFYNRTGLTSVDIPASVLDIGQYAFYGCSGLTEVIADRNVRTIANNVFEKCSSLNKVVLAKGMESVDYTAFTGDSKISEIYCYATEPPSVTDLFTSINGDACTLYAPSSSWFKYATHAVWSMFDFSPMLMQ